MKTLETHLKSAAWLALTLSAASGASVRAQNVYQAVAKPSAAMPSAMVTGVSHPEQIPVTTSSEGVTQPVVFDGAAPRPTLQARATPSAELPDPDANIVVSLPERPQQLAQDNFGSLQTPLVSSEPDPDAGYVTRVEGPANQLPVGTMLKVILKRPLSTQTTKLGTPFLAELGESVTRDGRILIPAGSIVSGRITEVHGGTRLSGAASIHLEPTAVTLPDGAELRIHGQLIDTGLYHSTKLDREGTLLRTMDAKQTVAVLALTTGSGAVAGAMLAGVPGALVGAGIGAGITTVVWLREDRQAELPVGTKLVFALNAPVLMGER